MAVLSFLLLYETCESANNSLNVKFVVYNPDMLLFTESNTSPFSCNIHLRSYKDGSSVYDTTANKLFAKQRQRVPLHLRHCVFPGCLTTLLLPTVVSLDWISTPFTLVLPALCRPCVPALFTDTPYLDLYAVFPAPGMGSTL